MSNIMHNFSDSLDLEASRILNAPSVNDDFSISVSAPGKVILFGEHSVVYGKLALAGSLGLTTKLTFKEQEPTEIGNSKVNINLHAVNLMHCYDLEDLETNLLRKNVALLKNIALEKPEVANHESLMGTIDGFINKNRGTHPLAHEQHQALVSLFYLLIVMVGSSNITLKPFDLTVTSNLTIGAGLGSSASYLVVISASLLEYVRFKTAKAKDKIDPNLTKGRNKTFSKKDLDLISKWAYSAEKIMHGTPSGLDNTICTYGSIVEFRKNSALKSIQMHYKLQILLINTKGPKNTKVQVAKVAALKQSYPAVLDNIFTAMENVVILALQNLLKLDAISLSDKFHLEQCQKNMSSVYEDVLNLVDLNQNLLRTLTVSHPLLDNVCGILEENGLRGKLTGAGGGGYAFAIIPTGFSRDNLEKVMEKLDSHGYDCTLTDLGGPGVQYC